MSLFDSCWRLCFCNGFFIRNSLFAACQPASHIFTGKLNHQYTCFKCMQNSYMMLTYDLMLTVYCTARYHRLKRPSNTTTANVQQHKRKTLNLVFWAHLTHCLSLGLLKSIYCDFFMCKKNSPFDCYWMGKECYSFHELPGRILCSVSFSFKKAGRRLLSWLSRWWDLTPMMKSAIIRMAECCPLQQPSMTLSGPVLWIERCVCLLVFSCIWCDCGLYHLCGCSMMIKITHCWLKISSRVLVYFLFQVTPLQSASAPTEPLC